MHANYIKQYRLDSYNALMGVDNDKTHNILDDHSSTVNLGLFKMETKSETDTTYENSGLTTKEYIEIALAILIVLGAARIIFRYLKKKKTKAAKKKKTQLKDLVVEAAGPTQGMSTQGMFINPFKQALPIQQRIQIPSQQQKIETQLVPINQEKENQIIPINMARLPLFPNTLYD